MASAIAPGSNAVTNPGAPGSETLPPGMSGSEAFQQQVHKANADKAPPAGQQRGQPSAEGNAGAPSGASSGGRPLDEAAFQKQMFEGFAGDVDEATQQRLSTWLPDVLNGGKGDIKETAKGLSKQEAADLGSLAKALDLEHVFTRVKDRDGLGKVIEKAERKNNEQGLEKLQRAYSERTLKASTPQLAPTVSYDSNPTIEATRAQVFDRFTEGLDAATSARLESWLPEAFEKPTDLKALSKTDARDLKALAEAQGFEGKDLYDKLKRAYKRDVGLATAGALPTVADLMMVRDHGNEKLDKLAAEIDLGDGDFKKALAGYEKSEFTALDSWLPAALAGQGEVPSGDPDAMALLQRFAERMGYKGDAPATPDQAIDFLKESGVIEQALHPERTGENDAFLLFSDTFLDNTLKYGTKNGAVTQDMVLDAANVAEMLLGPDDGTDAPRELQMAGLQAAILHRTDETLVRPQEMMAASGYIGKAETLSEQKSRLVESLLAFHVREEVGTPPMTAQQWAASYEEVHPELLDELGGRVFNSPTAGKMQAITQHLGVPGDHDFMIDKKRKIKIENDDLGNVVDFDQKKIKKKLWKKIVDVAVPVIGTVLSFVPGAQPIGMGINMAFSAYKGAEAIKHGDLAGGLLGIAGAVVPGGSMLSKGIQVASGALKTFRAIENKDWMGALAGGLGTVAAGASMRGASTGSQGLQNTASNFQTVANGVDTVQSIKDGDFLQAGAGMASLAGDAATYSNSSGNSQFAFQGLEQGLNLADGIQEKNYAGIGNAAAGLISTGHGYNDYRDEQAKPPPPAPEQGAGGSTNGETAIRPAEYTDPNGPQATQSIEVAGGDTLSQIAARHGTTVDDLMAANPGISDPNRIHAGQQLALPEGVQPVVADQQQKLNDFGNVMPSPPRPDISQEGLSASPGSAWQAYQQEFSELLEKELTSIDQRIADIDQELAEGINHAPVEYLRKDERLKLQAHRRDLQSMADDPDAALSLMPIPKSKGTTIETESTFIDRTLEVIRQRINKYAQSTKPRISPTTSPGSDVLPGHSNIRDDLNNTLPLGHPYEQHLVDRNSGGIGDASPDVIFPDIDGGQGFDSH